MAISLISKEEKPEAPHTPGASTNQSRPLQCHKLSPSVLEPVHRLAGHLPKAETQEERDNSTMCRNHHFTHTLQPEAHRAGRSTARRPRTDTLPPGLNRRLFLHAYLQLQHGTARNLIAVAHDTERYPHPNVNWQSTITRLAKLLRQAMSCRLGQQKSLKMYFPFEK